MGQRHKTCQPPPPCAAHDDGGVRYSYSCGYHTKGYRRDRRRRESSFPLSPVPTVVGDDKPYLPDKGTNDCDKPGWCSGPSYDPVTVVTRVQIPLRASPRFGVCRCLPGWCSGPSYDPVTVVTRVQIPLRAYSVAANRRAKRVDTGGDESFRGDLNPISRAQRPTGASTSDSGSNPAPGVFCRRRSASGATRHRRQRTPFENRLRERRLARPATTRAAPEARPPATPSSRRDRRRCRPACARRTSRGPSRRRRPACRGRTRLRGRRRSRPRYRR